MVASLSSLFGEWVFSVGGWSRPVLLLLLMVGLLPGCSVRQMAINKAGNALASSGTAFAADDDPELIRDAAPFSLKLMESLLAESPRHRGLLYATSSGFTQYAYAFVHQDADRLEDHDLAAAAEQRQRAQGMYRRARDYGLRGLEVAHPDFGRKLRLDPKSAVRSARKDDVPLLYWTAVSWAALISLSKHDPDLVADVPVVEALIDRAAALDESYDSGAIHNFLITYEMVRQGGTGNPAARARQHFDRAVSLTGGLQAGPYVSLAESVAVPSQDRGEFQALLRQALAVKTDQRPEWRLANSVMQRRARWLLAQADQLFAE
ncbi:MAG: TRAP transporter TatT component family protein [Betaproteobacteria bacterium]